VWGVLLNSVAGLTTVLTGVGEYRLISLTARFGPIASISADRIALNPYFDPSNRFTTVSEFAANGRRIRKGDTNFTEVWNTATEPQTGAASSTDVPILPGGVDIYYHNTAAPGTPSPDFGIITCFLAFSYRGRSATPGTIAGS